MAAMEASIPPRNQKTITIGRVVFDKVRDAYEKNRIDLFASENIKSFSAYVQKRLEKIALEDVLEGRFEITEKDEDRLTVRDYLRQKNAAIQIKQGRVFCETDRTSDCEHVGFVLANPFIIQRAQELGIKLRKSQ